MKSRAKPRDRPHPPRAHSRCQDPLARGARRGGGGLARGEHPGRAARAPVHVLPSRAGYRSPGGADSADARRPHDRRDRARLPRLARDDVAAALAGEGEDQGGRDPVQGSVGPPAAGAPGGGVAEVQSPEAALESLERLEVDDYQYLHSTRAELLRRLGRSEEARAAYRRALALAGGRPERRFLEARLAALERGSGHGAPKAR